MPYCSTEGKFQGYEDELEIEVDSAEASDTEVLVEMTVYRLCAGCSQQTASASLEISIPFEHECPKATDDEEPEYEVEGFDAPETVDEYVSETQHGKYKGKKGRFQTHLLGASINGTVTCSLCDEKIELDGEEKIPAGDFEVETSH